MYFKNCVYNFRILQKENSLNRLTEKGKGDELSDIPDYQTVPILT